MNQVAIERSNDPAGTGDMIRRCQEAGLPEPEFSQSDGFVITLRRKAEGLTGEVTGVVTGEVGRLLLVLRGEMKRTELQKALGLKHEDNFRDVYLVPAMEAGVVEMTVPDKPKSSKQKYRLTETGVAVVATLRNAGSHP